jgi:uncharacterized lipoprotein YmbA
MMNRRTILVALAVALGVAAGCASTPESHFYSLSAVAEPAAPPSAVVVSVGPVSVPAAVDRPQVVVTVGPNQVQLDEFNRWASPLQDEIAQALAGDLVVMLGTPKVTTFAHGAGEDAQYRVLVEVQRFESQPGVAAALDAAWTVRRTRDGKSESGRTSVREPVQQPGYAALAAAHSRAIGRLAQDISVATRSLEVAAQ